LPRYLYSNFSSSAICKNTTRTNLNAKNPAISVIIKIIRVSGKSMQILTGFVLALIIALAAWRLRALNASGAIAALILGTVIFGLGGLGWSILLLGFFISSSFLSRLFGRRKESLNEKFSKGSQRDAGQVLANGGIAGIFTLLHYFFPLVVWPWMAFAGALAAANADTWATELGVLSSQTPRLLFSWKQVERGSSGGVTLPGTLAASGGAALIGLLAVLFWGESRLPIPALQWLLPFAFISLAGLGGSLIDSLLGASLQAIYFCPSCRKETERHPTHSCGTATTRIRGIAWLNNDWVNSVCTLSGALLALISVIYLPASLKASFDLNGGKSMATFLLSSPAFGNGDAIPQKYTCDGANLSPSFRWQDLPAGTRSLALIVEDPDAPFGVFYHWIFYNIPPSIGSLPEGITKTPQVSGTGTQGLNSFRKNLYGGPCPPPGPAHRYVFKMYALDLEPNLPAGYTADRLQPSMQGHILAEAEWMGRYQRK
jgi:Raf kinase inhibitor-like YbhB/YbcL family protein/uncharacterized protein (TIGR00297 family)